MSKRFQIRKDRKRSNNRKRLRSSNSENQEREREQKPARRTKKICGRIYDEVYNFKMVSPSSQSQSQLHPRLRHSLIDHDTKAKYPEFLCFTWTSLENARYVVTIHDKSLFEKHNICISVGSHSPHKTIVRKKNCYGQIVQKQNSNVTIVKSMKGYALLIMICIMLYINEFLKYYANPVELINNPTIATIQCQIKERLDTFVVNYCNERKI